MPYAVAAVAAIGGAVISSQGAQSAANTQANAANNATAAQLQMFNQTQQNLAPYMTSGKNALGALNTGLGIGPNTGGPVGYGSLTRPFSATQYQQSPGYQFQFGQGVNAVQNSAAAAGGIGGGNTLRALTQFGQGLANSDYQQAFQNYMAQQQQQYGMLSNTAGSGQNAAAGLGAIGTQVGGQIGSNMIGAGNALAAGQVGSANALSGGLGQLAYLYGSGGYGGYNPYAGSAPGSSPGNQYNTYTGVDGTLPGGQFTPGGYYCDYALKKNIEPMYFDGMSGLQVYDFHYTVQDNSEDKWRGFIAQEVLEKYPEAVSVGPKGFLKVDPSKIPSSRSYPVRVPTEEEWLALEVTGAADG